MSRNDRAPVSSVFAAVAGVTVVAFVWGVWVSGPPLRHWSHWVMLIWAGMLGVGLLIWAGRALPGRAGIHWIGNPTLSMVAGVSGGAIAAVALAFALSSSVEQTEAIKAQNVALEKQLSKMDDLRHELQLIREGCQDCERRA